ncbi:MAG: hypothetical protein QXN08_08925 [Nitrososphaerales archaeon]
MALMEYLYDYASVHSVDYILFALILFMIAFSLIFWRRLPLSFILIILLLSGFISFYGISFRSVVVTGYTVTQTSVKPIYSYNDLSIYYILLLLGSGITGTYILLRRMIE